MSKYIDRDKLAEFARHSTIGIDANDIMRFPTADVVEVKHGKWKSGKELGYEQIGEHKIPFYENFKCSECGKIIDTPYKPNLNFCPNCGADMRGEIE